MRLRAPERDAARRELRRRELNRRGRCRGGFLAAASAGAASGVAAAVARPRPAPAARRRGPGSGVMMLTGGVEAAVGKSALVGLPVGIDGGSAATVAGAAAAGAFHDGA